MDHPLGVDIDACMQRFFPLFITFVIAGWMPQQNTKIWRFATQAVPLVLYTGHAYYVQHPGNSRITPADINIATAMAVRDSQIIWPAVTELMKNWPGLLGLLEGIMQCTLWPTRSLFTATLHNLMMLAPNRSNAMATWHQIEPTLRWLNDDLAVRVETSRLARPEDAADLNAWDAQVYFNETGMQGHVTSFLVEFPPVFRDLGTWCTVFHLWAQEVPQLLPAYRSSGVWRQNFAGANLSSTFDTETPHPIHAVQIHFTQMLQRQMTASKEAEEEEEAETSRSSIHFDMERLELTGTILQNLDDTINILLLLAPQPAVLRVIQDYDFQIQSSLFQVLVVPVAPAAATDPVSMITNIIMGEDKRPLSMPDTDPYKDMFDARMGQVGFMQGRIMLRVTRLSKQLHVSDYHRTIENIVQLLEFVEPINAFLTDDYASRRDSLFSGANKAAISTQPAEFIRGVGFKYFMSRVERSNTSTCSLDHFLDYQLKAYLKQAYGQETLTRRSYRELRVASDTMVPKFVHAAMVLAHKHREIIFPMASGNFFLDILTNKSNHHRFAQLHDIHSKQPSLLWGSILSSFLALAQAPHATAKKTYQHDILRLFNFARRELAVHMRDAALFFDWLYTDNFFMPMRTPHFVAAFRSLGQILGTIYANIATSSHVLANAEYLLPPAP